jgi:uncharacterized repeat protein (TIGR03803 family)
VAALAVFALTVAAIPAQAQTYTDLHDFNPSAGDPQQLQYTDLFPQGRDGSLYGVSHTGGTAGLGTVYSITLAGTPAILHSFDGSATGSSPYNGLTLGSDGNFYGVTPYGGSGGDGTVFKITPTGTLTVLHPFTNTGDGGGPTSPPVQGNDGNFYGTTSGTSLEADTFYKVTPSGTFKTLHTFASSEGIQCAYAALGSDGNFYGACDQGGASNHGTLFKISAAGHLTVLHSFTGTDGLNPAGPLLMQASDGNFYGVTINGGTHNAGVIYRLKTNGTYTVLYNFTGGADGANPSAGMTQGPDGNLYGTTANGGSSVACTGCGVIYKITTAGTLKVLSTFDGTHGSNPQSDLTLDTDGLFYGNTYSGGAHGSGVFYSFNLGFKPFVTLGITSGTVGTKVGILGQGFSSSSIVKFGGVKATSVTLAETTYITATVPAGAIDGKVTVTTGTTTLTSTQTFIVHNSWSRAAAMPTALQFPATGVINGKVYVVGGLTNTAIVGNNQVYNPATNAWTTGAAMPTPVFGPASAVVGGILYVIGGYETSSTATNVVQAYNPATNTWTTKAAMPTARGSAAAVVDQNAIYVIGGNGSTLRLNTVEKYVPATNTWTEEAPLLVGKSEPSAGLLGTTIVAADGFRTSGVTGDNEGYNTSTNIWSSKASDSTARNASCYGSISNLLYVAGGNDAGPLSVTESYSVTANKWTTLTAMPKAVIAPGSAEVNSLLYCFGGSNVGVAFEGTVYNYVQIYQP